MKPTLVIVLRSSFGETIYRTISADQRTGYYPVHVGDYMVVYGQRWLVAEEYPQVVEVKLAA
jgi:hypothetical protein